MLSFVFLGTLLPFSNPEFLTSTPRAIEPISFHLARKSREKRPLNRSGLALISTGSPNLDLRTQDHVMHAFLCGVVLSLPLAPCYVGLTLPHIS